MIVKVEPVLSEDRTGAFDTPEEWVLTADQVAFKRRVPAAFVAAAWAEYQTRLDGYNADSALYAVGELEDAPVAPDPMPTPVGTAAEEGDEYGHFTLMVGRTSLDLFVHGVVTVHSDDGSTLARYTTRPRRTARQRPGGDS